jgi:hypothetical protein
VAVRVGAFLLPFPGLGGLDGGPDAFIEELGGGPVVVGSGHVRRGGNRVACCFGGQGRPLRAHKGPVCPWDQSCAGMAAEGEHERKWWNREVRRGASVGDGGGDLEVFVQKFGECRFLPALTA